MQLLPDAGAELHLGRGVEQGGRLLVVKVRQCVAASSVAALAVTAASAAAGGFTLGSGALRAGGGGEGRRPSRRRG